MNICASAATMAVRSRHNITLYVYTHLVTEPSAGFSTIYYVVLNRDSEYTILRKGRNAKKIETGYGYAANFLV
jgi:hypothetical protein